ncbi:MAG TPA: HNH endonuclease [Pseudonocardiaceae bacterium]|nr:HNH endonuclease [Pseudonocardiaceae bacterium]
MADQTPNVCGNPSSVENLGGASGQTASELDKLRAEVNSDVKATVPDRFKGDTANALQRFANWLADLIPEGEGSPMEIYHKSLGQAAQTMQKAKQLLEQAQQFCAQNGLYLRPDLVVQACDPNRPDAQALVTVGQNQVDTARQIADLARQQIRAANQVLDQMATKTADDISAIVNALGGQGGRGRTGGSRTRRGAATPRPRATEESELLYGPEGRIRLPAPGTGTWSGTPGDSVWTPHNPQNYGLEPGQSIRWREGVPDLSEHEVPPQFMRDGGSATLDGLPLTGDYKIDNALGDQALANRFGMTPDQVTQWRQDNDYIYHHYSDNELQLVPGRVHRALPHQGSASELR